MIGPFLFRCSAHSSSDTTDSLNFTNVKSSEEESSVDHNNVTSLNIGPPLGQHSVPSLGQHSVPSLGQHSVPSLGQHSVPSLGQHSVPSSEEAHPNDVISDHSKNIEDFKTKLKELSRTSNAAYVQHLKKSAKLNKRCKLPTYG